MENTVYSHIQKMDSETQQLLQPYFTSHSIDEWVRDVLTCYFKYFLNIDEKDPSTAKKELLAALKPLIPAGRWPGLEKMEDFLTEEFHRKGFCFLGGMTGPYYGPYLWKRTEKRVFEVELPDRRENVNVFFMYDFLIRSWMHFQTYGEQGTGGWVKRDNPPWEDGLYCVADAYDMEHMDSDLVFQISMLKHEAQHFADKADHPDLSDVDLEYRAKLVELYYFPDMKYRFVDIIHEASPTKSDPHRLAAHRILKEISERIFSKPYVKDENLWVSIPYEKIQVEAARQLRENTHHLQMNSKT